MNRKAQTDIIAFIAVVVGILILSPIILKLGNEILGSFSTAINSTSETAAVEVSGIHSTLISFWDWIIAIAFLVNIVMLFISAFIVDSHPIFSVFYLISAVITLMFSHYIVSPVETILGIDSFSTEVLQLPITNFIVLNFDLILLGIIILTGIIMYGKFRSGSSFQR